MKHSISEKQTFKPIKLTITIESESELRELTARLDCDLLSIEKANPEYGELKNHTFEVWDSLQYRLKNL